MYKSTLAGHPLHPQLIVAPAGLLPFSFVMDVMHGRTGDPSYADAAYYSMYGGCLGALAAGAAGAVDYFSIPDNSRAKPSANIHASMNVALIAMYGANLVMRRRNGRRPGVLGTLLSGIGAAGLLASAWYGGHMVYEHGLRVKGVDDLEAAREIKPAGDEMLERTGRRGEELLTGSRSQPGGSPGRTLSV